MTSPTRTQNWAESMPPDGIRWGLDSFTASWTLAVAKLTPRYPRPMKPNPFQTLRTLLGIIGLGLMIAAFAVLLPVEWMARAHQWLGLGDFPDGAITVYLARSTSLLYAVHGFLMLYTAIHLRQFLPLAKVFGYLHIVIGLAMLGIDLTTPMPLYWTAIEGVPISLTGAALVWLSTKADCVNVD